MSGFPGGSVSFTLNAFQGKVERMPSITCTHCGAILKTKDPIPPGKKVKCPKCAQAFVVAAEEELVSAVPDEIEEEPAEGAGDEEVAPAKKGKPGPSGDGDEDGAEGADEDETPKKKGKVDGDKKSNKTLIIIIVAAVLVFCCCPSICGTIYSIFSSAINTAIGIDQVKKMQDDMKGKK